MFRTPSISAAIVAALISTLLIADPAAAADGDCAVAVAQPSRVSITSTAMSVPVELRDAAAGCASYASFDVLRNDGADSGIVIFDTGSGTDSWTLSTSDGAGRYRLQYRHGYDRSSDDLAAPLPGNKVTAKYSSRLTAVKVQRGAKTARVTATASQYRYFTGYQAAARRKVAFEKKTATGWKTVTTVTTSKKGVATAKLAGTRTSKWRARLIESSTAWGAASGSISPASTAPVPQTPAQPRPTPAPISPSPTAPKPSASPTPVCPAGRLYGTPVTAVAAAPQPYSSYVDVTITGYIRNDANSGVALTTSGPKVTGYDSAGYAVDYSYATIDYPDRSLSSTGTFTLQPGATVYWKATFFVRQSEWATVRSIDGSPTEAYSSSWSDTSVPYSCAGPEQDFASRPFLYR